MKKTTANAFCHDNGFNPYFPPIRPEHYDVYEKQFLFEKDCDDVTFCEITKNEMQLLKECETKLFFSVDDGKVSVYKQALVSAEKEREILKKFKEELAAYDREMTRFEDLKKQYDLIKKEEQEEVERALFLKLKSKFEGSK